MSGWKTVRASSMHKIPDAPGVYVATRGREVLYIGSGVSLLYRLRGHVCTLRYSDEKNWPAMATKIKYRLCRKFGDWAMIEIRLVRRLCPKFNQRHNREESAVHRQRNGLRSYYVGQKE